MRGSHNLFLPTFIGVITGGAGFRKCRISCSRVKLLHHFSIQRQRYQLPNLPPQHHHDIHDDHDNHRDRHDHQHHPGLNWSRNLPRSSGFPAKWMASASPWRRHKLRPSAIRSEDWPMPAQWRWSNFWSKTIRSEKIEKGFKSLVKPWYEAQPIFKP